MKAVLIVIFAVYVTTTLSLDENLNASNLVPKPAFFETNIDENSTAQCSNKAHGNFTLWDYSVVIGMLIISLKIGVFYGFFHKSAPRHTTENSPVTKMGMFPVTLSLTTSFVTAIELLGNPAEMYFYGTQFSLIGKEITHLR